MKPVFQIKRLQMEFGDFLGENLQFHTQQSDYGYSEGVLLITEDGREYRGQYQQLYGEAIDPTYARFSKMQDMLFTSLRNDIAEDYARKVPRMDRIMRQRK